jgi:hypothetical protein
MLRTSRIPLRCIRATTTSILRWFRLVRFNPNNPLENIGDFQRGMSFVGAALAAKLMLNREVIAAKAAPTDENRSNGLFGFNVTRVAIRSLPRPQ